jgi:hypothetical protein
MPDGRPKRVQETKSGQSGTHYGINIAGGGAGNKNPVSGKIIADNGRHGHLYICFVPPTASEYGAILFGAEDSAPIDRADTHTHKVVGGALGNTVGLGFSILDFITGAGWARQPVSPGLRAAFPRGQTGAYHAFGVSGDYSLTGGKKFKKLAKMHLPVPSGNDQMFLNPPRRLWEDLCASRLTFNINDLGDVPPPLAAGIAKVMPKSKHFYEETAVGPFHRRNENLRAMDELLKASKRT